MKCSVSVCFMPIDSHCYCFTITGVVIVVKKISMWATAVESSDEVVAEMAAWVTLACTFINIYIKSTGVRKTEIKTYISKPLLSHLICTLVKRTKQ